MSHAIKIVDGASGGGGGSANAYEIAQVTDTSATTTAIRGGVTTVNDDGSTPLDTPGVNSLSISSGGNNAVYTAVGLQSMAIGFQVRADSEGSICIGQKISARANYALHIGTGGNAANTHTYSVALGNNISLTGTSKTRSVSLGRDITVTESDSLCFGGYSTVTALGGIALGSHSATGASVSGAGGIAMGSNDGAGNAAASVTAANGAAFGSGSSSTAINAWQFGIGTNSTANTAQFSGLSLVVGGAISATGIVSTTDTTQATSTTAASLKTAGGFAAVKSIIAGDEIITTHATAPVFRGDRADNFVSINDALLSVRAGSSFDSDAANSNSTSIRFIADQTWTSGANGSRVEIWTCPSGSATSALALTIGSSKSLTLAGDLRVVTKTPASASATGITGTVAWDASYIYVCTATDTWKRTAIATW